MNSVQTRSLILGTRGSELALAQARLTKEALVAAHEGLVCEEKIIKTVGDQRQDISLTAFAKNQIVDKGIFTKELEVALAAGEIDVAVHSLKDLPTEIGDEFVVAAVLPREDTDDVLLTREPLPKGVVSLPERARIATSSVRRQAQLNWLRGDLDLVDIRGNVPTRLRKLFDENLDGIVLAGAGLLRLGFLERGRDRVEFEGRTIYVTPLVPPSFLPASGQGAIGLEIRRDDGQTADFLRAINDVATYDRIRAERAFLARLKAGCHTPVGIHTWYEKDDQIGAHVRLFNERDLAKPPSEAKVSACRDDPEGLVDAIMEVLNLNA